MTTETTVFLVAAGALLAGVPLSMAWGRGNLRSLTVWILAGMGLGLLAGTAFVQWSPEALKPLPGSAPSFWLGLHEFLRSLFINSLRMMVVPIIFTSILSGMISLGGRRIGRLGIKTLGYYLLSSLLAILAGLLLVNVIRPGDGTAIALSEVPESLPGAAGKPAWQFWFDFILGMLQNPVEAMATGQILPVIVFAVLAGLFIPRVPEPLCGTLSRVAEGMFQVMMRIVGIVLWLAPAGVYAIFVIIIAQTGPEVFEGLLKYALTVLAGLAIHACIVLPLILKFLAGVSPWRHFKAMSPALLTAFSTSSSSATLPLTLRCVEERSGVSNRTSSFVLPLGATVNMDGTALYECVAALFIAQIYAAQGYPVDLSLPAQITVVFTALMASIGAAGIPMAGLVMLAIILNALNLPLEGAGYVIAVDRLLDMCRTTVNVWSDSTGAVIIGRSEGETGILARWPPPRHETSLD